MSPPVNDASSSSQDTEVLKVIVDIRPAARCCALNYNFIQKVLIPSHVLFIIRNIFLQICMVNFFFLSFKGSLKDSFLYLKIYPKLMKEVPVFRQYSVVFFPIFHSGSVFSP